MPKNKSEGQIIQEFKVRKNRQILISIPAIIIVVICAVLAGTQKDAKITSDVLILGIPSTYLAIFMGAVILIIIIVSFINWRCPACNTYLGKALNPRFCISCGAKLQGIYDEETVLNNNGEVNSESELNEAGVVNSSKLVEIQNMPLAILGGFISSVLCSFVWAYTTYLTGVQIGFMAIGVGFLVGYTVRLLGKGISTRFGVVGALFSLFGCLMGNLLAVCIMAAKQELLPFTEVLYYLTLDNTVQLLIDTFHPKDLLFYALATYEGFKFSINQ